MVRGRTNRHVTPENGYFSHNASEIRLWMDGTFTLDGEIYHASREHAPIILTNGGDIEFLRIGD